MTPQEMLEDIKIVENYGLKESPEREAIFAGLKEAAIGNDVISYKFYRKKISKLLVTAWQEQYQATLKQERR